VNIDNAMCVCVWKAGYEKLPLHLPPVQIIPPTEAALDLTFIRNQRKALNSEKTVLFFHVVSVSPGELEC
jgi:hypothetical protein